MQNFRKEIDAALESYSQSLALFRQVGDRLGEANVLLSFGQMKLTEGDTKGARSDFQTALQTYRHIGDQYSQARALYRLGDCELGEHQPAKAFAAYQEAADLWNRIGLSDLVQQILVPRIKRAESGDMQAES